MDYKDFHDALLSISLILFIFSLTFIIGSIILKPYIGLNPSDRDFIIIVSLINIVFCSYYLTEALRLEKIFKLEDKYIYRFGKRLGIISLIYMPHSFFILSIFFRNLHNLQIMILFLILSIEILLLGVVFKEVYDLIFKDEADRKFELEKNRELYIEKRR